MRAKNEGRKREARKNEGVKSERERENEGGKMRGKNLGKK